MADEQDVRPKHVDPTGGRVLQSLVDVKWLLVAIVLLLAVIAYFSWRSYDLLNQLVN